MSQKTWDRIRMPVGCSESLWELFHENSKIDRHYRALPDEAVVARMARLYESLPFDQYPAVPLPTVPVPLNLSLADAILTRATARRMVPCRLGLSDIATILHLAYGVTRPNEGTGFSRPFRTVPSGGALYPLEIFFHSRCVDGLEAGLYHYNPGRNDLRFLRRGDLTPRISDAMVQKEIANEASLIVFITALFERSIFKYGERGYRFALLEAGHVAQNMNLVANGLGLGCVNIGGYFDREIDDLLGIDGLTHSTVYMVAIGRRLEEGSADVRPA